MAVHRVASDAENEERMLRGELYYAFTPTLVSERTRCQHACHRFNTAGEVSRRRMVELWRNVISDSTPLPARKENEADDAALFRNEPLIEPPIHMAYGHRVHVAANVYINFNCTILDTCPVTILSRTLVGPNVSFYAASHPLEPEVRQGLEGPELGQAIIVGEDCWIGGGATILPGVHIGRGSTVGAASVVTKDVPPFSVVAGNPARVIRRVEQKTTPEDPRP